MKKLFPLTYSSGMSLSPFNGKTLFLLIFIILSGTSSLRAQDNRPVETMLGDVSYVYLEKLIAVAKENYPRMKVYSKRIDITQNNINKARISYLDILTLSFIYAPNYTFNIIDPNYFDGIQVGLSFNIGSFLAKPYNVKDAKYQRDVARLEKDEYALSLESQIKRLYFTYIQQSNSVKLQSKIFIDAKNVMEQAKIRFERTEITFDQFSQANISYQAAIQAKMTAELGLLNAKASLEELLGRKLEEVK